MVVDTALILILIASLFILWYRISVKIPELVAIPDEVITARLEEDSARLRIFALRLKSYWKEGRYNEWLWKYFSKGLYRFHILLLRLDNWIITFLKTAKAHTEVTNGNGSGEYWKQLQSQPASPAPKDNRIREVRVKK